MTKDEPAVTKRAYTTFISEEFLAAVSGFPQKGTFEEIPLTPEDHAAHARAKAALEEIDTNPWVFHDYEGPVLRELRPETRFHPEETVDEWIARWRAAGSPTVSVSTALMQSLMEKATEGMESIEFPIVRRDSDD